MSLSNPNYPPIPNSMALPPVDAAQCVAPNSLMQAPPSETREVGPAL